ncbi:hypothetical protein HKO22_05415 [Peptoniphilus sp. AGMB00490]|uniref:ABC-2 family transporter protein n=1 Tax=Peptoniphilus faecalis TaxID=2731255 RepID=A0A848RHD3_9FIRM|nr:ABC-2 transporter permease [Peptoniphilus faecalis]NMW85181.1 hypothetical protein [Peptoniphilus faecalis]
MKILLLNDFKIRKKFIIVYFIFIGIIFALKSLGLFSEEFSFFADKAFAVLFMSALLIHYVLYIISSEGMIVDKSKPYLLTLGASRRDLINVKFLKVLIIFIIDSILVFYIMQEVEINGMDFNLGFFIVLFLMAYYLISIPIYLYFGQTSGVGTMFTSSPALLPILDKFGKDPTGFFIGIIKGSSNLVLSLSLIIFIIIIYAAARIIAEKKDF